MKSSKLMRDERETRREEIMLDRTMTRYAHARSVIQSRTQVKVFGKKGTATREYGVYPHSSTRQRARYARQLAAGQLNIAVVEPVPVKKPRARKPKVAANV